MPKKTLEVATQYRINQEIKFLYIKKTKLNEQLYKLHLECSNKWHNTWQIIQENMDQYLTIKMEKHYNNLNKKLDKLVSYQHHNNRMNTNAQGHCFYARTVNLTNITFTQEETTLLNKGLQHSIEKPIDRYWTDLIIETEQAIRTLDTNMQNSMRILSTTKLKQIKASSSHKNPMARRQTYLMNSINEKLVKEDAIITKIDKSKTCVIMYNKDYNDKVQDFLTNNNFQHIRKDPTNKYQQQITKTLQNNNLIVQKNQIKHLTQRKPKPPTLNAQIKIHKPGNPIRPVVNNTHAPAYKISKYLTKKLNDYLKLKNLYNVKNSTTFANDLIKLKIHNNYRMITFDIKDLYVNIPICETLDITKNLLLEHNDDHTTKQMISLLHTLLQQNYFAFQNHIFQPYTGIAMGSAISGIIAEIFLQYLENKHLNQLLDEKSIIFYTIYVDDLFLIYSTDRTNTEKIHDYLNNLHPNLEFAPTIEENNRISFLDLLITRQPSAIEIDIYRKPTATDTTINYTSKHPTEHKLAAYRYLIRRMTTLPLSQEKEEAEWQTILTIANNNNFPIHIIRKLKTNIHNKKQRTQKMGHIHIP
jgi:hypothetical protein